VLIDYFGWWCPIWPWDGSIVMCVLWSCLGLEMPWHSLVNPCTFNRVCCSKVDKFIILALIKAHNFIENHSYVRNPNICRYQYPLIETTNGINVLNLASKNTIHSKILAIHDRQWSIYYPNVGSMMPIRWVLLKALEIKTSYMGFYSYCWWKKLIGIFQSA